MKIEDIIDTVSRDRFEGILGLLAISANILADDKPIEELDLPGRLKRSDTLPVLESAAKMLLAEDAGMRFQVISKLIDSLDARKSSIYWLRDGSARQLVDMLGDASSARFAFSSAMRPCLMFAFQAAQKDLRPRIQYQSIGNYDCALISQIAAIIEVDDLIEIAQGLPWSETAGSDFEVELMMPPLGAHFQDNDDLPQPILAGFGLEHGRRGRLSYESVAIAAALRAKGRAIISVSDGELFRMVGVEPISRRNLTESDRLAAVMAVPPGLMFPGIMIKMNLVEVAPATETHDMVRFIDFGHEDLVSRGARSRLEVSDEVNWAELLSMSAPEAQGIVRDVRHDEIIDNSYVLTPERYLNTGPREKVDALLARSDEALLIEVADLIRPVSLSASDDGEYSLSEAAPGDVTAQGFVGQPGRTFMVDRATYNKAVNQQLRPGDLVVAIKGSVGTVGIVPDAAPTGDENAIWTVGQSMMIVRPKKRGGISHLVLYEYLSNSTVQKFIHSIAGGTAIPTLAMKDLKEFRIPVPDQTIVDHVETAFADRSAIFEEISLLEKKIDEMRGQAWPHRDLNDAIT
jgi:hypothetical protein